MTRRTTSEWASLTAALVVAGVTVSFGVAIVASFLHLPVPVMVVLVVAALAAIAYPVFRLPAGHSDPSSSASPAADAEPGSAGTGDFDREDRR